MYVCVCVCVGGGVWILIWCYIFHSVIDTHIDIYTEFVPCLFIHFLYFYLFIFLFYFFYFLFIYSVYTVLLVNIDYKSIH